MSKGNRNRKTRAAKSEAIMDEIKFDDPRNFFGRLFNTEVKFSNKDDYFTKQIQNAIDTINTYEDKMHLLTVVIYFGPKYKTRESRKTITNEFYNYCKQYYGDGCMKILPVELPFSIYNPIDYDGTTPIDPDVMHLGVVKTHDLECVGHEHMTTNKGGETYILLGPIYKHTVFNVNEKVDVLLHNVTAEIAINECNGRKHHFLCNGSDPEKSMKLAKSFIPNKNGNCSLELDAEKDYKVNLLKGCVLISKQGVKLIPDDNNIFNRDNRMDCSAKERSDMITNIATKSGYFATGLLLGAFGTYVALKYLERRDNSQNDKKYPSGRDALLNPDEEQNIGMKNNANSKTFLASISTFLEATSRFVKKIKHNSKNYTRSHAEEEFHRDNERNENADRNTEQNHSDSIIAETITKRKESFGRD